MLSLSTKLKRLSATLENFTAASIYCISSQVAGTSVCSAGGFFLTSEGQVFAPHAKQSQLPAIKLFPYVTYRRGAVKGQKLVETQLAVSAGMLCALVNLANREPLSLLPFLCRKQENPQLRLCSIVSHCCLTTPLRFIGDSGRRGWQGKWLVANTAMKYLY